MAIERISKLKIIGFFVDSFGHRILDFKEKNLSYGVKVCQLSYIISLV